MCYCKTEFGYTTGKYSLGLIVTGGLVLALEAFPKIEALMSFSVIRQRNVAGCDDLYPPGQPQMILVAGVIVKFQSLVQLIPKDIIKQKE